MNVATGLDRLVRGECALPAGANVGLICNPSSVDRELRHVADVFSDHQGINLVRLFGPEHGIRGDAQDMISVESSRDQRTGIAVSSLYGGDVASLTPPPKDLEGLDVLVFDVQDVGARYYTYVWTMVLAMRACAGRDIQFVVLDRPNPLGGEVVEGGLIETGFDSFVGLCSVPNRHGLTAGEIARLIHGREKLDVDLQVIELAGWQRWMYFDDCGLPWVMPSPNMPTLDTAIVYPGQCLVEGTELSEGRGTTRPFEIFGAPYVDGYSLLPELESLELPGARFRPMGFIPMFQKHARTPCGGLQIHVTDRRTFRSYSTSVALLQLIHRRYADFFQWREQAYEFVDDVPAIDLLAGSAALRRDIEEGRALGDIIESWQPGQLEFRGAREGAMLYT